MTVNSDTLTREELKTLMRAAIRSSRGGVVDEETLAKIVAWAEDVRTADAALELILSGAVHIVWDDSLNEPRLFTGLP